MLPNLCNVFLIISFQFFTISNTEYNPVTRHPKLLDDWAVAEFNFVDELKVAGEEILSFGIVQSYLQDYDEAHSTLKGFNHNASAAERTIIANSNPIAIYRMIRRYAFQFPVIRDQISHLNSELFRKFYIDARLRIQDLQDAAMGILRINHVYNYLPASFADGIMGDVNTGTSLKAVHCYEIAAEGLKNGFYSLAIDWLEVAYSKTQKDSSIDQVLVLALLEEAVEQHDKYFNSRDPFSQNFFHRLVGPIMKSGSRTGARFRQRDLLESRYENSADPRALEIKFNAICSKNSLLTEEKKSKLFCWYESKSHAFWSIGPLKIELLATDPDVVQIYDVIGEKKIQKIKDTVQDKLEPSRVVNTNADQLGTDVLSKMTRTSVNGWVDDCGDPTFCDLSKTVEKITGLTVKASSSDELQVASYTFGGHYKPHMDALIFKGIQIKGERIATFLAYLEEPELGGQTAFMAGGVVALPIKGSAVLWYGIHKDGEPDFRTYHGACPVVLGRKWIANKWIRLFDQIHSHPCDLVPGQRHRFRVNNKPVD